MKTTITAYISEEANKIRKERMNKEENGWFSNWLDYQLKQLNKLENLDLEENKKLEELKDIQERKKLLSAKPITNKVEMIIKNLNIHQIAELHDAKLLAGKRMLAAAS